MNRIFIKILLSFAVLALPLSFVLADTPGIPHQFYGTVSFNNGVAPDGLVVEARNGDTVVGSSVTKNGKYGYNPNLFFVYDLNDGSAKDLTAGQTINFFVSGINTGQTFAFANGGYTSLNLTILGSAGVISKGARDVITNEQVVVTPSSVASIKMGDSLNVAISSSASTSANIEKIEKLTSVFFTGTRAVIAGDRLLNAYEIKITGDSLNINITMNYDPNGIDENTVKPYYYDGTEWVLISGYTRDTVNHTISYTISAAHTPYAIFGQPPVQQTSSNPGGGGGTTTTSTTTQPVITVLSQEAQKVDTNKDNKIDILDFNSLMVNWGSAVANNVADFNADGKVDILDFNLLMVYWTK